MTNLFLQEVSDLWVEEESKKDWFAWLTQKWVNELTQPFLRTAEPEGQEMRRLRPQAQPFRRARLWGETSTH